MRPEDIISLVRQVQAEAIENYYAGTNSCECKFTIEFMASEIIEALRQEQKKELACGARAHES